MKTFRVVCDSVGVKPNVIRIYHVYTMAVKTARKKKVDKFEVTREVRGIRGKALAFVVAETIRKGQMKTKATMMREAGFSEHSIKKQPQLAWNSKGFIEALKAQGLGIEKIGATIGNAMEAGTVVAFKGDATETDAPDHKTRLQAAGMLAKYTGLDVARSQNVNVNVEVQTQEALDLFEI